MSEDISQETKLDLAQYSRDLAQTADDAGEWVQKNGSIVRNEQEGLLKELRKARRAFKACARAADRQMCAGVFGPSQAGKSYLISALARGESNELIAQFGDEEHDFISEINPEGGTESTGLVTRFTMVKPSRLPANYPVQTRLLSETDIVKILANTYYADCEHMEEEQSNIEATLNKLKSRVKSAGTGLDIDSLEDLREYLLKDFRGKARVQELERKFWDEALELGQKLDLEGRIQLYALIWDEVPELTNLLRKLLLTLEQLKFPDILYCSMKALIPRKGSIIDVATLKDMDNSDNESIPVRTPDGIEIDLPRPIITALTAELTIVMRDKPAEYFEHTDLLDFPGYRSRYQLDNIRSELKKNKNMLQELFLRGKVAYLFQRYCAERELTSMLLCIGPGNQEVQDLPGVISDWVAATHGPTPEERKNKLVSLFFVLTKFDVEFDDKKGAPSLEGRWDTRLKASLLDFFGKQRDWPSQWTPNKGFNNTFLLRNPNYKFDSVLSYNGDVETGVRPERQQFVDNLHNAFMNSQLVAEHFQDPAKAWNEAMRLNDGGISFIRKSLSPLCDPQIKQRQLLENIKLYKENIERRLRPFYQTDDRDQLRQEKANLVNTLWEELFALEQSQQRLGELLRTFTINDANVFDLYPEAARRFREKESKPVEEDSSAPVVNVDINNFNIKAKNPFLAKKAESIVSEKTQSSDDEAAFYAAYIENKWVERLHQLADDPDFQKYFQLSARNFSSLASELATGVARLGFKEELTKQFRKVAAYANTDKPKIARRQAAIAARILNDYINWLDFANQNKGERTITVFGQEAKVFEPHPDIQGVPDISEERANYTQIWFGDWLNALAGLIMDNVNFDGTQSINMEENFALGQILKRIDKNLEAA